MRRSRLKRDIAKGSEGITHMSASLYGFSVYPRRGHRMFTVKEAQGIAAGREAVVEDDVIDLYHSYRTDAKRVAAMLKRRGYRVSKVEKDEY